MPKLTPKQKAFVEHYAVSLDAMAAYRAAGYKVNNEHTAHIEANRLVKKKHVQEALQKLRGEVFSEDAGIALHDIVRRQWQWASFSPRQFFNFSAELGVSLKDASQIPEEAWTCVQSIKNTREGIEIKFVDRQKAMAEVTELLGLKRTAGNAIDDGVAAFMDILNGVSREESQKDWLPTS